MLSQHITTQTARQFSSISPSTLASASVNLHRTIRQPRSFSITTTFPVLSHTASKFKPLLNRPNVFADLCAKNFSSSAFTLPHQSEVIQALQASSTQHPNHTQAVHDMNILRSKLRQCTGSKRALILASILALLFSAYHQTASADATPATAMPPSTAVDAARLVMDETFEDVQIAPLWKRFIAFLIDNVVTSALFNLGYVMLSGTKVEILIVPISFLLNWMYDALLTSYHSGQTFGKVLLSIQTINSDLDLQNEQVPLLNSTLAFFGKLLNVFLGCDVIYCLLGNNQIVQIDLMSRNSLIAHAKRVGDVFLDQLYQFVSFCRFYRSKR